MWRSYFFWFGQRAISLVLIFSLATGPTFCYAQSAFISTLPEPGAMVASSSAFVPVLLKGMTLYPNDPLQFDFIVDSGNTMFTSDEIKQESGRLVKYFLAAMTVPQNDLWVNLSPYEADRIIPDMLGKTELGRDMLAQDYILKQLSASLLDPEKDLGKDFWARVYKQAQDKFGVTEIPVDTFNKVWIMPQEATVYEKGNSVYLVKSRLKVMLDQDYKAMQINKEGVSLDAGDTASISLKIIREIILPEISREVNEGKNFAPIRQIYQALILAKWYKETIKESLLSKVYIDQKKIKGVDLSDPTVKEQIYDRYVQAFKKGVINLIQEDYDAVSQQSIPRKYFSGGEIFGEIPLKRIQDAAQVNASAVGSGYKLSLRIDPKKSSDDKSMFTAKQIIQLKDIKTIMDWLSEQETLPNDYDLLWLMGSKFPKPAIEVAKLWNKQNEDGKNPRVLITGGVGRETDTINFSKNNLELSQKAISELNNVLDNLTVQEIMAKFHIRRGYDMEKHEKNLTAGEYLRDWIRFYNKPINSNNRLPEDVLSKIVDFDPVSQQYKKAGVVITEQEAKSEDALYIEDVVIARLKDPATRYATIIPEGMVYYAILRSEGVSDASIEVDAQSTNSVENIMKGEDIIDGKGIKQIVLVQEPYIQRRGKASFERSMQDKYGVNVPYEVISYAAYKYDELENDRDLTNADFELAKTRALDEVKKLKEYPVLNKTVAVNIPANIEAAYQALDAAAVSEPESAQAPVSLQGQDKDFAMMTDEKEIAAQRQRLLSKHFEGDEKRFNAALEEYQQAYKKFGKDVSIEDILKDEFLLVTDEHGQYTKNKFGQNNVRPRELVHLDGTWHRTGGVFVVDEQGRTYMQQRAFTKKTKPGAWDVSAGGHFGLDADTKIGLGRELEEEFFDGKIVIDPERLLPLTEEGQFITNTGFEKGINENAVFYVYLMTDEEKAKIKLEELEVNIPKSGVIVQPTQVIMDWLAQRDELPKEQDLVWLFGTKFTQQAYETARFLNTNQLPVLITGGIGRNFVTINELETSGELKPEAINVINQLLDDADREKIMTMFHIDPNNPKVKVEQIDRLLNKQTRADAPIPEGVVYWAVLRSMGIAQERILVDAQSTTTEENIDFGKAILKEKGIRYTKILAVQESAMERRAAAGLQKGLGRDVKVYAWAPFLFEGKNKIANLSVDMILARKSRAIGEIEKIRNEFSEEIAIPKEVMQAYGVLTDPDFNNNLEVDLESLTFNASRLGSFVDEMLGKWGDVSDPTKLPEGYSIGMLFYRNDQQPQPAHFSKLLRVMDERKNAYSIKTLESLKSQIPADEAKILPAIEAVLKDVKLGKLKYSYEDFEIFERPIVGAKVIGVIDRNIAERAGLVHMAVDAMVLSPQGKVIVQQRSSRKNSFPLHLTIPGGHVDAGNTPESAVQKEIEEEVGVKGIDFQKVGGVTTYDNYIPAEEKYDLNRELRQLFVVKLDQQAYDSYLIKKNELEFLKSNNTQAEFEAKLEKNKAYGEVWGYHEFDLQELHQAQRAIDPDPQAYGKNTRYIEITNTFSRDSLPGRAYFTPDFLDLMLDNVSLVNEIKTVAMDRAQNGGIDMNEIAVDREGVGAGVDFDPLEMQDILSRGVDGFVPVIINLTPISSFLPIKPPPSS